MVRRVWRAMLAALVQADLPRMGGTGDGKPKRVDVVVMEAPMRRRKERLGGVGNLGEDGVLKPPLTGSKREMKWVRASSRRSSSIGSGSRLGVSVAFERD